LIVPTPAFDAHTHLDHPDFAGDLDAVVARARAAGVDGFVVAAADPERWSEGQALGARIGATVVLGVHPWDAGSLGDQEGLRLLAALRALPMVGVGEIGLDALRARDDASRARQRRWYRDQLAIARERALPVVLHGVRAWPEVLDVIARDGPSAAGGMAHAWTGAPDLARRAVALGLHVSFGPAILRDRALRGRASVSVVPIDRLLVETDCPSMAPVGVTRGEPAHVIEVAAQVASLRGEPLAYVLERTRHNARALFGIADQTVAIDSRVDQPSR
jgi:TatD DNase family protein